MNRFGINGKVEGETRSAGRQKYLLLIGSFRHIRLHDLEFTEALPVVFPMLFRYRIAALFRLVEFRNVLPI